MTIPTQAAAKKICQLGNWKVSNLKLQKILYLAHQVYLGRNNGEPMIDGMFEAWDYGPVVPSLYHDVKMFGKDAIQDVFFLAGDEEKSPEGMYLEEACHKLLPLSAAQLVAATHIKGGAWDLCYSHGYSNTIIPNEKILKEYNNNNG